MSRAIVRLARRGRTDQRDGLAALDREVESVEHGRPPPVAEGHPLEAHRARAVGQRTGVRNVGDRGIGREDRVDATRGRGRAGQLADEHADHAQRPDQHDHVEVRRDDVADREVVVQHLVAAVPEDADEPERRQQVDERHEVGAQPRAVHRAVVDAVGLFREPTALQALDAETLHDAHTGDALLDDARDVGELLLQLHADRVHAVVEAGRGEVEQRQQTEREQREARAAQQQDHDDRGHLDRARDRQRDQQDHVVDLLDVGVRVRHQLAGLGLVVEREVEPLQVRDEPHADVGLDPPCETERGVAAQSGPDRLHRADPDDRGSERQGDPRAAARDAVVDRLAREQRHRHPRRGPHQPGDDPEDHQLRVGANRLLHEAPALLTGLRAFLLGRLLLGGRARFRLALVVHLERGYRARP